MAATKIWVSSTSLQIFASDSDYSESSHSESSDSDSSDNGGSDSDCSDSDSSPALKGGTRSPKHVHNLVFRNPLVLAFSSLNQNLCDNSYIPYLI